MRLSWIGAVTVTMLASLASAAPNATQGADSAASAPAVRAQPGAMPRHAPTLVEHYVDLNSASRQELMTLPGIGAVEAGRIIANRPYLTKTELVTKKVLTVGPFLSVKRLVVAMPQSAQKGRS